MGIDHFHVSCFARRDEICVSMAHKNGTEPSIAEAIQFGQKAIIEVVALVEELRDKAGLGPKPAYKAPPTNPLVEEFRKRFGSVCVTYIHAPSNLPATGGSAFSARRG